MHHHPVEPARGEDGVEQDDVRYYLLNSDMSVKEICDHLGSPTSRSSASTAAVPSACRPRSLENKKETNNDKMKLRSQ